jgi:hypothetical protein
MKNLKITEHIPAHLLKFTERETVEFNNTNELLNIEFVKSHLHQEGFYRFSISDGSQLEKNFML